MFLPIDMVHMHFRVKALICLLIYGLLSVGCFEIPPEPEWSATHNDSFTDIIEPTDGDGISDGLVKDIHVIGIKDTIGDTLLPDTVDPGDGHIVPTDTHIPSDLGLDAEEDAPCEPVCDGTTCGDDQCGGFCVCPDQFDCQNEICVCVPQCDGKNCGEDGCGSVCGECDDEAPEICGETGLCQCAFSSCDSSCCGVGETCHDNSCCSPICPENPLACGDDSCGGSCGSCEEDQSCLDGLCCTPQCNNAECGGDGCGGSCGVCDDNESCSQFGECLCSTESILCADTCCNPGEACNLDACCAPDCGPNDCGQSDGCGDICTGCDVFQNAIEEEGIQCQVASCLSLGESFACVAVSLDDSSPCTNTNACTVDDICLGGSCADGPPKQCADFPCLESSCFECLDPEDNFCVLQNGQCTWAPIDEACSDSDACTENDACDNGVCNGDNIPNCDDGNACTTDSCDPGTGCVFEPNELACNDGLDCTQDDICFGGTCSGTPNACNDGDPCTNDICTEGNGCVSAPLCDVDENCDGGNCVPAFMCEDESPDGTPCGATTQEAVCIAGICCFPECAQSGCGAGLCSTSCGQCSGISGQECTENGCVFITPSSAMAVVPAGWFTRGCAFGGEDNDCLFTGDDSPAHSVYLPSFEIDQIETTLNNFSTFVSENGSNACGENGNESCVGLSPSVWQVFSNSNPEDSPARFVTWDGAYSYCESVGKRLCTEAEWEKAARGTEEYIWPWGNIAPECTKAIFGGGCGTQPVNVTTLLNGVSLYGVQHLAGNVSEWVNDWYEEFVYTSIADGLLSAYNPTGPTLGTEHVVRGGSFYSTASQIRTGARASAPADLSGLSESYISEELGVPTQDQIGFRCCRSLD